MVRELVDLAAESGPRIKPRWATASESISGSPVLPTSAKDANGKGPCLSFEQYTIALSTVHQAGHAPYLNRHFLPQDIALAPCAGGLLVAANEMEQLAPVLQRSYELFPNATMHHGHASGNMSLPGLETPSTRRLCRIAQRELEWLGRSRAALPEASETLTVQDCQ